MFYVVCFKLVSQYKEKRALRPVVNIVCSVHREMEELQSYYRHSFSYLSFKFIYFTSFIFFYINLQNCLQLTNGKKYFRYLLLQRNLKVENKPLIYTLNHKFSTAPTCRFFPQEFKGNTDQSSIIRHRLKRHLYTAKVLLYPTSYFGRMCMSVEIYGCRTEGKTY